MAFGSLFKDQKDADSDDENEKNNAAPVPMPSEMRNIIKKKLTVWCALWAGGIIGPYFFKNDEGHNVTVNGDRYTAMITNFFIPELNNHDVQELWFQQDGATCHTARATIDLLKDTLGDRLISRFGPVNWPPRSCDLTPLDYFLVIRLNDIKHAIVSVPSQTPRQHHGPKLRDPPFPLSENDQPSSFRSFFSFLSFSSLFSVSLDFFKTSGAVHFPPLTLSHWWAHISRSLNLNLLEPIGA
ncbi:uncharacterized protein TNCV_942341 [Trichonephila clavipes]|nr:uncharacterized protein TNCV_942341 [Trichonephila clavipes]